MKLLRYGATTDRLRDPRGPAYSADGQVRIRPAGNGSHPVAKRRQMQREAFEAPGPRQSDLANKLAAKRKSASEREAEEWIAEVRRRAK